VTGYRLSGSTGTVFLFGIMVGAVAPLELSLLLAGARRTASRAADARRRAASFNVKRRSSTGTATPDSHTNSEPTAPRGHQRSRMKAQHGDADVLH
jgi:hypothetical protein